MHYLILHGTFGSNQGNWFPWLKEKLEEQKHTVTLPQFPIEDFEDMSAKGQSYVCNNQNLQNWLNYFESNVFPLIKDAIANNTLVIIAHSLAPLFCLDLIQKFNLKLKTAVFVAPFLELTTGYWQYDQINADFVSKSLDFNLIKRSIGQSFVYLSNNDPYVSLKTSQDFARAIGSKELLIEDAGHFNANFGYTTFPALLELLASLGN